MNTRMPLGIDDFAKARRNYYIVDKTDMIRRLLDGHGEVMLFTRPRRFGKTLTMSMLDYFFSLRKKKEGADLFRGMAVEKAGPAYMREQGKYPVIMLSLKDLKFLTWEDMLDSFAGFMSRLYESFSEELSVLRGGAREYASRVVYQKASLGDLTFSLARLTDFLSAYYGRAVILLIDEYDAPLQSAYAHGYYEECISFLRNFFSAALKSNPSLDFAVLTGVLRIAKESIFSGLNNVQAYSVLSREYSNVFGFTAEDIEKIARDLQVPPEKRKEIKEWYDGYLFGGREMYNPWSVVSYIQHGCAAGPYWVNTSANEILQDLLPRADAARTKVLQDLLTGGTVKAAVREGVIYRDLAKEPGMLYSLLLTTGYLTAAAGPLSMYNRYALRIPNKEVREAYSLEILNHLSEGTDQDSYAALFEALLTGDGPSFKEELSLILRSVVSAYDAAGKESFYHGFMLGMTALFLGRNYTIESNRESGYGRFDLAVFPKDSTKAGVLMEFKAADRKDALKARAEDALRQIRDKQYGAAFEERGIHTVWKYGIAFCGKQVEICMK